MTGKINVVRKNGSWLEGCFFWPAESGCSENDQHLIMDLFIVWNNVDFSKITNDTLMNNIIANLDSIGESWINITTNTWLQDRVKLHTNYLMNAILNQIWGSGFDIEVVRKYYRIITKAARDLEAITKVGFKKLVFTKLVIIPTSINVEGILRKKSIRYYAITAIIVNRSTAKMSDLKEFIDLRSQVIEQEMMQPSLNNFKVSAPLFNPN